MAAHVRRRRLGLRRGRPGARRDDARPRPHGPAPGPAQRPRRLALRPRRDEAPARCRPPPAGGRSRRRGDDRPRGHSHRGTAAPAHPGVPRRRGLWTAGRRRVRPHCGDREPGHGRCWAATWTRRWRRAGCSGAGWPFSAACSGCVVGLRAPVAGGAPFRRGRAAGRPRGCRAAAPAGHARRRPRRRFRRAGQCRAAARRRGRRSPFPAPGRPRRLRPRPGRAARPPGRRPGAVAGPGPGRPGPPASLLGRVWRTGTAERGATQVDGEARPLLAAALRDPVGDRIGVVVLERSPGAAFDDADLRAVAEAGRGAQPQPRRLPDLRRPARAGRLRGARAPRPRDARRHRPGAGRARLPHRRAAAPRLPGRLAAGRASWTSCVHGFSETLADLRLQIADLRIAVRPDQGLGAVVGARLQRFGSSTGLRVVLRLERVRVPAAGPRRDDDLPPAAGPAERRPARPRRHVRRRHPRRGPAAGLPAGAPRRPHQPACGGLPRAPHDGAGRGHPRRAPLPRWCRRPDAPAPTFVPRGLRPSPGRGSPSVHEHQRHLGRHHR